ncbi:VapE domain-containing protein [Atlantibacter subterraneus]|uniref:VapE domain-containing protein n=1 Tax=Atlantibacter subterraneus TaxID=255519 RepID=UPI0028A968F1|nr:VapE domain-containing protein [Atlantibacter subterranea]
MNMMPRRMETIERARSALNYIDPACDRGQWVKIGQAIHSEWPDDIGLALWDGWSKPASNYREKETRSVWCGFKQGGGVTVAALYGIARDAGWRDNGDYPETPLPTPEDIDRHRAERERLKHAAKAEEQRKHAAAAKRAREILASASNQLIGHAYFERKGRILFGNVRRGKWIQNSWSDALLVPIYDADQQVVGIEAISPEGEKRGLSGCQRKDVLFPLKPFKKSDVVLVAEGLSTAAAGMDASTYPAVCAFGKSNLAGAAKIVKKVNPAATVIVLADIGAEKYAHDAAAAVNGLWCVPEGLISGNDFWDLWKQDGVDAVGQQIVDCLKAGVRKELSQNKSPTPPEAANDDKPASYAVAIDADESRERSGIAGGWESKLPDVRMTRNGPVPLNTAANLRALCDIMEWRPCLNEMDGEYEVLTANGEQLGGSLEGQYSAMVSTTQRLGLPKDTINDHLPALCREASYHPVRRWLHGAKWDGAPRVDAVITTLNAKDPHFAQSVIVPWLIGCVACLYEPKFSSKLVPVLQGDQSLRKSAWVSRIAGVVEGAYFDGDLNPKDRDSVKRAVSRWIFEFAELESTTKRENGHLKAFLSSATDRFRSPYARTDTVKRRQTSFIGTVNGDGFLKDPTGSTRYAVIEMAGRADMDTLNDLLGWSYNEGRIRLEREEALRQFWLEVKAKYDAGETWMLSEDTLQKAAAVNDNFTDKGSVYEFLMDYHVGKDWADSGWFTAADVVQFHGGNPAMAREYGKALKRMASENIIEMKEGRSRRVEYLLRYNRRDRYSFEEGSPI